jgi:hypothetical protein
MTRPRHSGLRTALAFSLAVLGALSTARADSAPNTIARIADATTEMDLERATRLLDTAVGDATALAFERARLAVYSADCDAAQALLSAPALAETREGASLAAVAGGCARATAAGFVVEDKARGIWLRLQDDGDRVLAPFLFDVADKARSTVGAELGADLPRPLRIDLVRDLFSLSAVSGLPLEAAETTGTLAIARFGRVIMLSPRAPKAGYPFEDTLAHEITHLFVTRATRDHAPLWLQEGVAKRLESHWRPARPFDDPDWADVTARRALENGTSVGIDALGPSIAMLPTPEAASTAFAEVTSFITHFVAEKGKPALGLLFHDMKGLDEGKADAALRSVSGYSLSEWNRLWQKALLEVPARDPRAERRELKAPSDYGKLARLMRLGDLMFDRGALAAAERRYDAALEVAPAEAIVRFRAARTRLARRDIEGAKQVLGDDTSVSSDHGGWLALRARIAAEEGKLELARTLLSRAVGLDPLAEVVACEGYFELPKSEPPAPVRPARPTSPEFAQLCDGVRNDPGRTSGRDG